MLLRGCRTWLSPAFLCFFFFQAEDGIRDVAVTGVQTCALPISLVAQRIRVLIIDDNRLMREGLSALLKAQPDLQVVGAVADLAAALGQVPEFTPHVVLVDAGLGSCDGCRCVEQIRRSAPAARVIVMDLLPAPEEVVGYVKAGAKGFIMKDATVEDLVGTVRSVARGSDVIPAVLTGTLLSHIARDAVVHQRRGAREFSERVGWVCRAATTRARAP